MTGPERMKLNGGPFDGAEMDRPAWRWQVILAEDSDSDGVVHRYKPTRDPSVWKYDGPDHVVWRGAAS